MHNYNKINTYSIIKITSGSKRFSILEIAKISGCALSTRSGEFCWQAKTQARIVFGMLLE